LKGGFTGAEEEDGETERRGDGEERATDS